MNLPSDQAPESAGASGEDAFLIYHLNGARFAKHEVPLPFLGELQTYQRLFLELARRLYKDMNPGRRNVPKGFDSAFSMNLQKIGEGSSLLCVSFENQTDSSEFEDIKTRARSIIENGINSVVTADELADEFPSDLCHYLSDFGKNLNEGETSSFLTPSQKPLCVIDVAASKKIRMFVESKAQPTLCPLNTEGIAYAIDTNKTTFGVKLDTGESLPCPLPARYTKLVISAIAQKEKVRIQIKGNYIISPDGKKTVREINHVGLIDDSPRIAARINEFKALPDNWLDNASKAPSHEGLDWLNQLLDQLIKDYSIPSPFLYPTPEGNVQAEWCFGEWLMEGVFSLDQRTVDLAAYHHPDDHEDEFERSIRINQESGIYELVALIIKYSKA